MRKSYQQLRGLSLLVIGCHIILGGRWFHIIFLNVPAPKREQIDDVKESFNEELELIFDKLPK
jgi:hypothetical protein